MGLFVAEDGHYQGWLAALLCCFAAVNDDESPVENRRVEGQSGICTEQPIPAAPHPNLNAVLTLKAFKGNQPNFDGARHVLRVPEQAPSLSPLDFGDRALIRTWPTEPEHKHFLSENRGTTIMTPQYLRLYDPSDSQKPTLVPLRLGPVVLRDLSSAEDGTLSSETSPWSILTGNPSLYSHSPWLDAEYLGPREAPLPRSLGSTPTRIGSMPTTITHSPSSKIALSTRSSTGSLPRLSHQTSRSSVKSRSSSERPKAIRKRSFPSIRRDGDERLDQEILELNTIVEERRAETARENPSDHHIPAVAPLMQIGVRSETLNAIGSALSRPLTAQSSPRFHDSLSTSPPIRPVLQRSASTASWSSTRLSGWLSNILPTSSRSHYPGGEPFYKCQSPTQPQHRHNQSTISTSTSWTEEQDYPSLTAGSSPTSKGHSRTLTDESQFTFASRPGTSGRIRGMIRVEKGEDNFVNLTSEQVGVAF